MGEVTVLGCPFCGEQPTLYAGEYRGIKEYYFQCDNDPTCDTLTQTKYCQSEVRATKAWNTRRPEPAVTALVEAGEYILQTIEHEIARKGIVFEDYALHMMRKALKAFKSTEPTPTTNREETK